VDSKAECDQLNLAQVDRNQKSTYKKETETNKRHTCTFIA